MPTDHDDHGDHEAARAIPAARGARGAWSATGEIDTLVVAITDMQGRLDGQARPGPGVPRRRHRPRRPLLHLPPGHGHGDEHARGLRADELGDRLRRLDRRAGLGHAPRPAVAREDGPGPRGRAPTARPARRSRSRRGRSSSARSRGPPSMGFARQGRLGVRVLRPQGLVGGASPSAAGRVPQPFGYYNEDYHLLQATKAEPLHRLLRNQMTEAAESRSSSARARRRTASTRSTSATTTSSSRPTGA